MNEDWTEENDEWVEDSEWKASATFARDFEFNMLPLLWHLKCIGMSHIVVICRWTCSGMEAVVCQRLKKHAHLLLLSAVLNCCSFLDLDGFMRTTFCDQPCWFKLWHALKLWDVLACLFQSLRTTSNGEYSMRSCRHKHGCVDSTFLSKCFCLHTWMCVCICVYVFCLNARAGLLHHDPWTEQGHESDDEAADLWGCGVGDWMATPSKQVAQGSKTSFVLQILAWVRKCSIYIFSVSNLWAQFFVAGGWMLPTYHMQRQRDSGPKCFSGIRNHSTYTCVCKLSLQQDGRHDTCKKNALTDEDFTASMISLP